MRGWSARMFQVDHSRLKRVVFRGGDGADHFVGGGFIKPMHIGKYYGQPQTWTSSMLPLSEGRRHAPDQRKVDVKRLRALQVQTRPGHWLVSARRVIADAAKPGLPVGEENWDRRGGGLLRR
mmetsp:Transcript_42965/g.91711  ORF Transcript_42965/g.91711 Transcript_42965/m.91711 type:complete len:122 (-) Transcript_42965:11-376(-)